MPQDRYNLIFTGELLHEADKSGVREKLGTTFRLDAAQLDNLFSGQHVVVKRDVDLITATRFQQAFFAAGARAEIESAVPSSPADTQPANQPSAATSDGALTLAPPGAPLDEVDDRGPPINPDTSALSLMPGDNWDLADCAPPPVAAPVYDLDALTLAPLDVRRADNGE